MKTQGFAITLAVLIVLTMPAVAQAGGHGYRSGPGHVVIHHGFYDGNHHRGNHGYRSRGHARRGYDANRHGYYGHSGHRPDWKGPRKHYRGHANRSGRVYDGYGYTRHVYGWPPYVYKPYRHYRGHHRQYGRAADRRAGRYWEGARIHLDGVSLRFGY